MGVSPGGHDSVFYRTLVPGPDLPALSAHPTPPPPPPPQEASCKNHRVNRVVFLGNMKRLLTTGVSRWNTRQIALWDQVSCMEAGWWHKRVVALGALLAFGKVRCPPSWTQADAGRLPAGGPLHASDRGGN